METFTCLDCDNEFTISVQDDELLEQVQFCPFCGENSIVKKELVEYE